MKICDYLKPEYIFLNTLLTDKESVLRFVADSCVQKGVVKDAALLYQGLENREKTMSTGIGGGIAFPHTTNTEVEDAAILLICLSKPMEFEALDNRPVDTIIPIVVSDTRTDLHIRLLARISRLCKNPDFLGAVRRAESPDKLWEDIKGLEAATAFH